MNIKHVLATAGAAVMVGGAAVAHQVAPPAQPPQCFIHGALPDPQCTPGAVNPAMTAAILCDPSFHTTSVRPPVSVTDPMKRASMAQYGDTDAPANYEYDHLVSLELGGAPSDPSNLWPEPYAEPGGARTKDKVENAAHKAVCAGTIDLTTAQQAIATDWVGFGHALGATP